MLKQILIPFIACLTLVGCDTSNKVDVESTETETTSEVCEIETDTETGESKENNNSELPVSNEINPSKQDPYDTLYLQKGPGKIKVNDFIKVAQACPNNLDLAITYTNYHPESTQNDRVIGLGFSTISNASVATCYEKTMLKLGAIPLPKP